MAADVLTAHLRCSRPGDEDAEGYRDLLLDPAIQAWLWPAPLRPPDAAGVDRMRARDAAHWDRHGFGPWAVRLREDGAFAGRAGLQRTHVEGEDVVEVAWAVVPALQGRGVATEAALAALEAARDLGLADVVAFTLTTNTASQRVMERVGMALEGEIVHAGLPHVLFRLATD